MQRTLPQTKVMETYWISSKFDFNLYELKYTIETGGNNVNLNFTFRFVKLI